MRLLVLFKKSLNFKLKWNIGYFAITAANETNTDWLENGEEKITDPNPDIALLVLFVKLETLQCIIFLEC